MKQVFLSRSSVIPGLALWMLVSLLLVGCPNASDSPSQTYTVTYNGNDETDGSPPVDNREYRAGATVTVLGNTGALVKNGSLFAGWSTASGDGGTSYSRSETFLMPSENVTLYVEWNMCTSGAMCLSDSECTTDSAGPFCIDGLCSNCND